MMKKALAFVLSLVFVLCVFGAQARACPMDGKMDGKGECPYHTPNSYDKKLSAGDKFLCANCGQEGVVAANTAFLEHEGKYYYFMSEKCKGTFMKKVDEFYKGKEKG